MFTNIENFRIGIIGGGRRCKALLESIFNVGDSEKRPQILGVADRNQEADGLRYARHKGLFTTADYRELFSIEDIDLILELTPDDSLREQIREAKPPGVLLADHHEARAILDYFRIKGKKTQEIAQHFR